MLGVLRKDGQDTTDDLRKRSLRDELEDRERRHFSSKDKDRGYGKLALEIQWKNIMECLMRGWDSLQLVC